MFKWICLGVAVVFLGVALVMLNDIRLQVRRSADVVVNTGELVIEDLPGIVERSKETTEVVSKNLPEVVEKVRVAAAAVPQVVERIDQSTELIAELTEDLKQLKELAGIAHTPRDKSVVAYADSMLKFIENSGGEIGVKKNIGTGLKNTRPAADWVRETRREAVFLAVLGKSKKQMLEGATQTKLGFSWYIQLLGKKPMKLYDWLKENHPESRDL